MQGGKYEEAPAGAQRLSPVSLLGRGLVQKVLVGLPWLCCLALAACDPFHVEFEPIESAQTFQAGQLKAANPTSELRVMNYNVKFGGGRIDFFFDCHGDRVLMDRSEVVANLERLAQVINAVDPDLLFIQEVDINAKRSAYVNQLQWLLDHTQLNYGVYASQWRADFVPSDGIGAVDSGNGILSRYPFRNAQRLALPLRTDQSKLERYFYLRRNILQASLLLPDAPPLALVAIHAEAYAQDGTKLAHIQRFQDVLAQAAEQGPALGAGDLNTIPPGSVQTKDFDDSACKDTYVADDYSEESDYLTGLYERYYTDLSLEDYAKDNPAHFTHTTSATGFWNRRLDYMFSNRPLTHSVTYQSQELGGIETMPVSDHAPIGATLELTH
jgi:endonuclease/exonuclease/phosphatase family metal-dependent hydrolase